MTGSTRRPYTNVKSADVRLALVTLLSVSVLPASWLITDARADLRGVAQHVCEAVQHRDRMEVDDVVAAAGSGEVGDHVVAEERREREGVRAASAIMSSRCLLCW